MSTTRSVNVYHHEKSSDLYYYINIYYYPVKHVLNDLNMDLSIFSGIYIYCIVGRTSWYPGLRFMLKFLIKKRIKINNAFEQGLTSKYLLKLNSYLII